MSDIRLWEEYFCMQRKHVNPCLGCSAESQSGFLVHIRQLIASLTTFYGQRSATTFTFESAADDGNIKYTSSFVGLHCNALLVYI